MKRTMIPDNLLASKPFALSLSKGRSWFDKLTTNGFSLSNFPNGLSGMMTMQRKAQQGFSLVSAIFLLVVIAALGAFAVTLSTTQHQSAAMDVMGARAYQASRAGIDWAAFQLVQSSVAGGAFATACRGANTEATRIASSVTLAGTLTAFNPVSVSCWATSAVENTTPVWVYSIASSAVTAVAAVGSPDYIERVISVTIAQ